VPLSGSPEGRNVTADPILRLVRGDVMSALINAFLDACAIDNLSPHTIAR
jgi:hypothetical protein